MSATTIVIPAKTIKWCAMNTLFNLFDGAAPAHELAKLEQVGIDWMSNIAPHQNYGKIVNRWYNVGEAQRQVRVPPQAIRVLRVGLKFGNHTYSLTVSPNLAMPSNFNFECDPYGGSLDTTFPMNGGYAPFRATEAYNTDYYRFVDGLIIFDKAPPQGHLYLEWLEAPGHSADSIVHAGYVNSLRLHMTARYYEMKMHSSADAGTNSFNRYKSLADKYDNDYFEDFRMAKLTVKCPKIDDFMDAVRGWG